MTPSHPPVADVARAAGDAVAASRQSLDVLPAIAWEIAADGAVVHANARWFAATGSDAAEPDLDAAIHPDDLPGLRDAIRGAIARGAGFEFEYRLRNATGEYRWHVARGEPRRGALGSVGRWVAISTDVHELQRAQERFRLLAGVSELLAEHADPGAALPGVTRLLVPAVADWGAIDLLDGAGRLRRVAVAVGEAVPAAVPRGPASALGTAARVPADDATSRNGHGEAAGREAGLPAASLDEPQGLLVRQPSPELLAAVARDAEIAGRLEALPPGSLLIVPISVRRERLGMLTLAAARSFGPHDRQLAEDVARRTGTALAHHRLYEAERRARELAQQAARRTANLQEITAELADAPTAQRVAEVVVERGVATLDASARALAVLSPDGDRFEVLGSVGFPPSVAEAWRTFTADDDVEPALAVRRGAPIVLGDAGQGPQAEGAAASWASPLGPGSLVLLPLMAEARAIGVIALFHPRRVLAADEVAYLEAVAQQCVQPLVRARLRALADAADGRRAESLALLDTLVGRAPAGIGFWDPDLRTVRVNDALAEMLGVPAAQLVGRRMDRVFAEPVGRRIRRQSRVALRSGRPVVDRELEVADPAGARRHWLISVYPVPAPSGRLQGVGAVITDVTERSRAEAAARFMADAGQALNESLDYERTLATIARLAVPRIADWCSVEMAEDDGSFRQLAVAHTDPAKEALARRLREEYPLAAGAPMGAPAVARTREPEVVRDISDELIDTLAPNAEVASIVRALGLRSYICVPMIAQDRVIGAITFVLAESGRHVDQQDVALAVELARYAAAAVEQARLYRDLSRLAATLDAVADGILMFDPDTLRFVYVNQGAIDQVGYSREELLERTPLDIKPLYDEDSYRALLEPLLDGHASSRTIDTLHRHHDGHLIPVEVSLQYVKLEGAEGRMVSIARDVTDRVDAEARLHRLAQAEQARAAELAAVIGAIGDGVVVCAPTGEVTHANPAASALLGGPLTRWEAIFEGLEDPDGVAPVPGVPHRQGPVELRRVGDREQWLALTAYPVPNRSSGAATDPEVIATILLVRDVTEARESQRAQEAFIGVLSHELRTPVTTIYAGSKVLGGPERSIAPEIRSEVYADIAAESERLYRLVEDLLVLARFEGVKPGSLGDEPVLLQRILPDVVELERTRFPATRFETEITAGLPTVRAERTYVEQVTRNLLANAAKYSPPGTTVRLVIAPKEEEIEVRVLDEGPGFPPEESERLFELFYRSPATSRAASGAGIGLFVCRRLVEAMGGRMWARPRAEGGSEFGFTLTVFNEEEA